MKIVPMIEKKHKPYLNALLKYKVYFLNLCMLFAGQHIGAAMSD
jgi:hypothetical protein